MEVWVRKVAHQANKTCPVHCGQGDLAACLEHRNIPLGFDIRTFGERKTHSPKNLNSALVHLMKRMQRTNLMWRSRKRDVDARECVGFFFSTDFFSALVKAAVTACAPG